jgi:histone H2A
LKPSNTAPQSSWISPKLWQNLATNYDNYYLILKSYLHNRRFQVKLVDSYTDLLPVNAGVLQGSVLGPLLYLLYTADLPTSPDATIVTFADDTAILATDPDPAIASEKLQTSLLAIQHWLTKWRLKANSSKSTHVTFTIRRATCPQAE